MRFGRAARGRGGRAAAAGTGGPRRSDRASGNSQPVDPSSCRPMGGRDLGLAGRDADPPDGVRPAHSRRAGVGGGGRCGQARSRGLPQGGRGPRRDIGRCLVVEDAPTGIQAGRAAGAQVLAVATSHPASELTSADAVVPDLTALEVDVTAGPCSSARPPDRAPSVHGRGQGRDSGGRPRLGSAAVLV